MSIQGYLHYGSSTPQALRVQKIISARPVIYKWVAVSKLRPAGSYVGTT